MLLGRFYVLSTHRGHRSKESLEFRNARFFCFHNCKFDPKKQETLFTGSPENLKVFIESTIPNAFAADIPDCPRGLVLSDNHGTGAFQ
jgi:hypothetical protein